MEIDLQTIVVECVKLEAENIKLKKLVRLYKSKPDVSEQIQNMLHYNKQVSSYKYSPPLVCLILVNFKEPGMDRISIFNIWIFMVPGQKLDHRNLPFRTTWVGFPGLEMLLDYPWAIYFCPEGKGWILEQVENVAKIDQNDQFWIICSGTSQTGFISLIRFSFTRKC